MMPSRETDPLLPKGDSAPEISGYGFSTTSDSSSKIQYQQEEDTVDQSENEGANDDLDASNAQRPSQSRTMFIFFAIVVGSALFITLLLPGALHTPWTMPPDDALTISARVTKILSENPLIDGHNDLPILIRYGYQNDIYGKRFKQEFENGGLLRHTDLPRLKHGKVGGAFWSAFTLCPENGTDFSDENYVQAVSTTLAQLDLIRRLIAAYPGIFLPSDLNSSSALSAFKTNPKLISPIGVEGLHQIGNSFSNLRLYHSLGVKYSTLTHNCNNAFADAAVTTNSLGQTVAGPAYWDGLSAKGQLLVREMNRMGMLVDLAHVSKDTMLDVLGGNPEKFEGSKSPIIFSHSSAFALCPHPRNVPDDVLQLVKKTNSIVMVNFAPEFISCLPSDSSTGIPSLYPPNATLHQVARHVTYIGDLIGYDHVGLGSDFDGIPNTPQGLDDVSKFPDLIAELLHIGVSDRNAAKIVGQNILRVWGDAEKVSSEMQADGVLPAQDEVEKIRFLLNVT